MYYLIVAAACITGAAALLAGLARNPTHNPEDQPMEPAEPTDYERILREGGTVRVPFDSDSILVVSIAGCHLERLLHLPLSPEQEWGILLASQHPGKLNLSWEPGPDNTLIPNENTGSPVYETNDPEPQGAIPSSGEEPAPDRNLLREALSTRRRLLTPAPDSPPKEKP